MAAARDWVTGARPRPLPAAIVPVVVGTGVAVGYGRFSGYQLKIVQEVITLIVFVVMYFAVFGTGITYMLKLIGKGPHGIRPQEHSEPGQVKRAARPLSAAPDNIDPAISK